MKKFLILPLFVLVLAGSGCGSQAEITSNDTHPVASDTTTNPTNPQTPTNWPNDIPFYSAGATGNFNGSTPLDNTNGALFAIETTDTLEKVASFYKTELPKQGWQTKTVFEETNAVSILATKNDKTVVFSIGRGDKKTTITIGISK